MKRYRVYSHIAAAFPSLVTGTVTGIVRTVPLLRHTPSAAHVALRTIWKTPRLGPWLKTTCLAVAPIGIMTTPPLMLVGGAIAGLALGQIGAWSRDEDKGSFLKFCLNGIKKTWVSVDKADEKLVEELMPQLRDYLPPPLEENETVYEVNPIRALTSFVSALLGTFVEAPAVMMIFIMRLPMIDFQLLRMIWTEESWGGVYFLAEFLIKLLVTCLLVILNVLACTAAPLVTIVGSLGVHVQRGYTKGLAHAWSCIVNDLRKADKVLRKFGEKPLR